MTTPKQPPAVLIVHGAYFTPDLWDPFRQDLSQAGFKSLCPRLPTCGDAGTPPQATIDEDIAAVRTALLELADAGHPVIVLAHSYGGIVASAALSQDLVYARHPRRGGVVQLIFLCAWVLQPGWTIYSVIQDYAPMHSVEVAVNDSGTAVTPTNGPDAFYNDIERERAQAIAARNVSQNMSVFAYTPSGQPWKYIPTTYVYTRQDRTIYLSMQEIMVRAALANGGSAELVTESLDTAHCPFLSKPTEVVAIVQKVWATVRET